MTRADAVTPIAALSFPFRANTNAGTALVPTSGPPILVDAYEPTAADRGRADWRAAAGRHPDAFPIAPGEVSVVKALPGDSVTIRVRTATADCHACRPSGAITVAYHFDRAGRLLSQGIEKVE